MHLHKVNPAICLIAQLTFTIISSEPLSMYVKQEETSSNYIYVNFYKDMFQRLYDCMTDTRSQCTASWNYQTTDAPYHPEQNLKVSRITAYGPYHSSIGYFVCQNNQNANALVCTKHNQCTTNMCISFRYSNSSACSTKCVNLMWNYSRERFQYDNNTHLENCNRPCTGTTSVHMPTVDVTEQSPHPNTSFTLPLEYSSESTTNSSNTANIINSGNDGSPNNHVPIIIGVILGVLCIAIIVFSVIYRRKKLAKKHTSKNSVDSPRTNNYNAGPTRYNCSDKPDMCTLPYSGHGSGESEDGYYTIDSNSGLNSYENGLHTISLGISPAPEQRVPDSRELNRYTNEITFSPQTLHNFGDEDANSQTPPAQEGEYYTLQTENDDGEDNTAADEEKNMDGEYSVAKGIDIIDESAIDVIDVSSTPKNIYSRLRHNDTDIKNPYDMLLQKHHILNSGKTSVDFC